MTPEFSSLVNPTFDYVLNLAERLQQGEHPHLEIERDRIRHELEEAEVTAAAPGQEGHKESFRLAKRALVYWADEVLSVATKNASSQRDRWSEVSLSWALYDEQDWAWRFYVEGEQAKKAGIDALEVFYLAMVLGFEGDILNAFEEHVKKPFPAGTDERKARETWAGELYQQISARRPERGPPAPPPLEGDVTPLMGATLLRNAALGATGLTVLLLILLAVWKFG